MPAYRLRIPPAILPLLFFGVATVTVPSPISAAEDAAQASTRNATPPVEATVPAPGENASIADTETRHSLAIDGEEIEYVATAGTLVVPDEDDGGPRGHMFYVAYSQTPRDRGRPLTFVFNGGPGAAAAYLHMGAMGPMRVDFGTDGRIRSGSAPPVENRETWIEFTDLVFVDPIGTGYSRGIRGDDSKGNGSGAGNRQEASFWETGKDLDTLGAFIRLYLSRYDRWSSPIVVAGESYGGFRAAALADRLQSDFGIAVAGVVMISPALELDLLSRNRFRLMPWVSRVPSLAAAARHHGRGSAAEGGDGELAAFLQEVESFAMEELLPAAALGNALDSARRSSLLARLAGYVGLPEDVIARYGARLPPEVFGARLLEAEQRVVSLYDASISYPAPHPAHKRYRDPRLSRISAASVSAFNHHVRASLGLQTDLPYEILNRRVSANWRWREPSSRQGQPGAAESLESAFKQIDGLRALLVHGLYDLVTPYYASTYLLNQLDLTPVLRDRIAFRTYGGGHMFYSNTESRKAFRDDARQLYGAISGGLR